MNRFILLLIIFCSHVYLTATDLIPRKVLFGNPEKTQVRISPDGKFLSYLAPDSGALNVWICSIDDISHPQKITNDVSRGIRQYFWAENSAYILYLQDYNGDENFKLYSYGLKTKKNELLSPERNVKTTIFGLSPLKPDLVLIGLNERNPEFFDPYLLNLNDNTKTQIFENNRFSSLVFDNDLNLRFGVSMTENGDEEIYEKNEDGFQIFATIPMEDASNTGIVGFADNNESIYFLDSRSSNTTELVLWNLKTNQIKKIANDPKSDLSIFTQDPKTNQIQAIEINFEKPKIQVIDSKIEQDIKILDSQQGGCFSITSRTLDDKIWIVAYYNDTTPPTYYRYNKDQKKLSFLFAGNPELAKCSLNPMSPMIIKSRDGLDLVCYLTLPKNEKKSSPPPLILYVHGGPWVRDFWGLNPVHQWLSNRGYAVMSVNYRGSSGFGKNFLNAGNLQWSLKMHDDLIDCVNYAINQKIADPQKIGIMGGSYGGYATLVGLTFTPDIFALGIDIVGPSNLVTLCQSFPPYWKPIMYDMKRRVGDWETAEGVKLLMAKSPITHVDEITKPLFIAQGAYDPRVKQAESDQIFNKMQEKKIPVLYALYPYEGHGFAKEANKLSFYAMTEQFLKDIMHGFAEPIENDFKGSDFSLNGIQNPTAKEAVKIINENITK